MKIYENLWKSMKIYENQLKLMKIYENLWKSMKIHENPCKSIKIYENLWKSMKIHKNLSKSIKIKAYAGHMHTYKYVSVRNLRPGPPRGGFLNSRGGPIVQARCRIHFFAVFWRGNIHDWRSGWNPDFDASISMKIHENQWKSMKIYENQWKFMKIN